MADNIFKTNVMAIRKVSTLTGNAGHFVSLAYILVVFLI